MRADRLVSLVLLLQARGRMTARALAGELGVSVRTIYRDLEGLSAAGVPVFAESGPGGGCQLVDGYRFPLRALRPDEAEALLILGVPGALRELGLDGALTAAHRQIRVTAGLEDHPGGPGRPRRWFTSTCPAGSTATSRCRTCAAWPKRSAGGGTWSSGTGVAPIPAIRRPALWRRWAW